MTKMVRRWALVLAGALTVVVAAVAVASKSHDSTDPALGRLGSAVEALRDDPVSGSSSLPKGVSTYYEPAAAGARELRGSLYMPAAGGRCAVADVTVSAGWFTDPGAGSFTVEDPRLESSCPGG
jgi:hypothetical protein